MKKLLLLSAVICLCFNVFSQKKGNTPDKNIDEYKENIKMMVKYLEDTFTFIGDPENTTQEKDIIFRESYTKIFENEDVQIEDDLDQDRRTSINKDVQAYLKDIDFFFKDVTFSFSIEKIEAKTNDDDKTYFLVTTMRSMNGHSISGDTVSDRRKRFMEINLEPFKKELKIASIYTTKPNENEALRTWWNTMPPAWKQYLGEKTFIFDSIELKDLRHIYLDSIVIGSQANGTVVEKTMAADMTTVYSALQTLSKTTEINVSDNIDIHSLEPLAEMSDVISIDCSNTDIIDVSPIRNLSKIKTVNISNTLVDDISSLKYNSDITTFKADYTNIGDIETVSCFTKLNTLSIVGDTVSDITPINSCGQLTYLDISGTNVTTLDSVTIAPTLHNLNISSTEIADLEPIRHLEELQSINLDNTNVTDLSPLSNIMKLNEIEFSNTRVSDLMPLKDIPHLIRIYCDNTGIDSQKASEFQKANGNVMVIYETATLRSWWDGLQIYWKTAFTKQLDIDIEPNSEELHRLIQIKSLEVDAAIQDVTPISRLTNLERLCIANTKIIDIQPLKGLLNLKTLEMQNTKIRDLKPLEDLGNLQEINIENTLVADLTPLHNSNNLLIVRAENSKINKTAALGLKNAQPQVTIIYQTKKLESWWNTLDNNWREIFKQYVKVDLTPKPIQLQKVADITEITVNSNDYAVSDLEPLSKLYFLKKLIIKDNQLKDLTPLAGKDKLEELDVSGNAIENIFPLAKVTTLKSLAVENTLVDDINILENMHKLKVLNISGTSVKNIKVLANCRKLEELNIANTPVKSLSPIQNIPTLKHVKAFNTKVRKKDIDALRASHDGINIVYY
ncbi:MAG: leucine-rich repeat domain-containing protein [Bacteroidales bacterium]|nr:leucine-rich repeat domain-containing protein [Bacteroidales bacterium]